LDDLGAEARQQRRIGDAGADSLVDGQVLIEGGGAGWRFDTL